MDLDELRAFLAVVDSGSFAAAARTARFARATLTRRIEELESRAGTALFDRTKAGPRLTSAGEVLATEARGLLEHADRLLQTVRGRELQKKLTLEVIVPPGSPPALGIEFLSAVTSVLPMCRFLVRTSADPLTELRTRGDFALHVGASAEEGDHRATRLRDLPIQLVVSPSYLKKHGTPTSVEELSEHRVAIWNHPGAKQNSLPLVKGGEHSLAPFLVHDEVGLLREYAAAGHCIAYVANGDLDPRFEPKGELIPLLVDEVGEELGVWIIVSKSTHAGVAAALLPPVLKFMGALFATGERLKRRVPKSAK